jgi:hypothetical protein
MDAIVITRRAGLLGLLFAPAIVRFPSLMPISPTETYPLGGMLLWQQFTDEALRLFRNYRRDFLPYDDAVTPYRTGSIYQRTVTGEFEPDVRSLPIQELRKRFLAPAMYNLASAIPAQSQTVSPALPDGIEIGAISSSRENGLRAMAQYEIGSDRYILQFDTTFVA